MAKYTQQQMDYAAMAQPGYQDGDGNWQSFTGASDFLDPKWGFWGPGHTEDVLTQYLDKISGKPQNTQDLYRQVALGLYQPKDFSELISPQDGGLSQYEFDKFSPQVQAWAKANPQAFAEQLLAHGNSSNGDLGSVGAAGGYSNLGGVTLNPDGSLNYNNAGYMQPSTNMTPFMIMAALTGGAAFGPGLFGGAGTAGPDVTEGLTQGLGQAGWGADAGGTMGVDAASFVGPATGAAAPGIPGVSSLSPVADTMGGVTELGALSGGVPGAGNLVDAAAGGGQVPATGLPEDYGMFNSAGSAADAAGGLGGAASSFPWGSLAQVLAKSAPGLAALKLATNGTALNTSGLDSVLSQYGGGAGGGAGGGGAGGGGIGGGGGGGLGAALTAAQGLNTSSLESLLATAQQGAPDTAALRALLGQSVSPAGILSAAGTPTNTSALQGVLQKAQQGPDTAALQQIMAQMGANSPAFVQAAIDPFQKNVAAGYGDLRQSLAQRGMSGSSFGNMDESNFLSTGGQALSDAGARALMQSLLGQGQVAGQVLGAQQSNLAQQGTLASQLAGLSAADLQRLLAGQGEAANVGLWNLQNQTGIGSTLASLGGQNQALQGQLATNIGSQKTANTALQGQIAGLIGSQGLQSLQQQGSLETAKSQLALQQQLIKNQMYGNAFNALGQGLNPVQSLFGTNTTDNSALSKVLSGLGSGIGGTLSGLGNGLSNIATGLGSGLSSLFNWNPA